jgi:hypothetical protein
MPCIFFLRLALLVGFELRGRLALAAWNTKRL